MRDFTFLNKARVLFLAPTERFHGAIAYVRESAWRVASKERKLKMGVPLTRKKRPVINQCISLSRYYAVFGEREREMVYPSLNGPAITPGSLCKASIQRALMITSQRCLYPAHLPCTIQPLSIGSSAHKVCVENKRIDHFVSWRIQKIEKYSFVANPCMRAHISLPVSIKVRPYVCAGSKR